MTLTVTAVAGSVPAPRVLVTVASSPAVTDALKVFRVHADGTRHRVLTVGQAVLIAGWVGYDYHAPFNQAVTYVAEAGAQTSAASNTVRLISKRLWLVHPSDPNLSMAFATRGAGGSAWAVDPFEYKFAGTAQRFDVLNRAEPVHRKSRPRGKRSGAIRVRLDAPKDRAAFEALVADGGQLLINSPLKDEIGWQWVQPGDVSVRNPAPNTGFAYRWGEFPFDATTQPDADLVPEWTFDQVAATFATFDQVKAIYDDFKAMQLDVRTP